MPLKLLQHKSYHVYNKDNIERVRRDEEEARVKEEEADERLRERDRLFRLEILRRKQLGEDTAELEENYRLETSGDVTIRENDQHQETENGRAIVHAVAETKADQRSQRSRKRIRDIDDEISEAGRIIRESENATRNANLLSSDGHINLFGDPEKVGISEFTVFCGR